MDREFFHLYHNTRTITTGLKILKVDIVKDWTLESNWKNDARKITISDGVFVDTPDKCV